ncbi:MAG: RNA polymerase sporulation sigma factor SigH [Lachnospiraceae bacterium]|nr:RNA polymerase sporulation sigma factor SigH [Lachnospiraceae bacterium]
MTNTVPNDKYQGLSDEEMIIRIRENDTDAMDHLIDRYRNLVRKETREVYMIGADSEDLVQEGMIGLFKAIRDYTPDKKASFYTFASLCIKRQIYSAVTSSNRKKNAPLNNYVSFYADDNDGYSRLIDSLVAEDESDPEASVLLQERLRGLIARIESDLSKFERTVLDLYLDGQSYTEIAKKLSKTEKSIDNAIQRIRRKLSQP